MWGKSVNPHLSQVLIYKKSLIIKLCLLIFKKMHRKSSDEHISKPLPENTQPKSEKKSMPLSTQTQQESDNPNLPDKTKISREEVSRQT